MATLADELQALADAASQAIREAADLEILAQLKVTYLGKKGRLTAYLKSLGRCSPEERPILGQQVNQIKQALLKDIQATEVRLKEQALAQQLAEERLDVTQPGRQWGLGSEHPVTQVTERMIEILSHLGFEVATGPEIEDDFHNFEALNFPAHHPARALHDTFYLNNGHQESAFLLRTHTSSVQIRVMSSQSPPFRVITPGRVYRRDADHTHTPMFHQLEALVVDTRCHFSELKGLLQYFINQFFEREVPLRFRPSYFPFTEPSAEVDVAHDLCDGRGCRVCGGTGWLEILGCGMVHPNVLRHVNIDPSIYRGYAFGLGLDRLAMLRYGIDDLRILFDNDLRLLKQF